MDKCVGASDILPLLSTCFVIVEICPAFSESGELLWASIEGLDPRSFKARDDSAAGKAATLMFSPCCSVAVIFVVVICVLVMTAVTALTARTQNKSTCIQFSVKPCDVVLAILGASESTSMTSSRNQILSEG